MDDSQIQAALLVLVLGGLIFLTLAARSALDAMRLPPLAAFILIGAALGVIDDRWGVITEPAADVLGVLGDIGIIALLFRVGLESNLRALRMELEPALPIWLGNVALAGLAGYLAAWWLGADVIERLFVAAACTATSVGVSVVPWKDAGALGSRLGRRLLDVAELDDISGVALMALLLATAPALAAGASNGVWAMAGREAGLFAVKLAAFCAFCYGLSRFLEPRFTSYWRDRIARPDMTVLVAATGMMIAALAGALGLSIAIGALLAGFVFSPDRDAVEDEGAYAALIDVFAPFFFIAIGMQFSVAEIGPALALFWPILIAAILGKLIGAGLPAARSAGLAGAALMGVSMIPRAEIAMIIMERGHEEGLVSAEMFTAMILVALTTALAAPVLLQILLRRWPQA